MTLNLTFELDLSRSVTLQIEGRISEMSSTQKTNQFGGITFDSTPTRTKLASPTWLVAAILDVFIVVLVVVWPTSTSVIYYV